MAGPVLVIDAAAKIYKAVEIIIFRNNFPKIFKFQAYSIGIVWYRDQKGDAYAGLCDGCFCG